MRKKYYMTAYRYPLPAQYEQWFEDLARDGWHPVRINHNSSIAMTMEQGEARIYRYVVDLQAKKTQEYMTIYGDLGWEYVGRMSSMHIWRQEYTDTRPQSFTDQASQNARNKRFYIAIMASFWAMILAIGALAIVMVLDIAGVTTGVDSSASLYDLIVDRVLPMIFVGGIAWYIHSAAQKVKKGISK